MKIQWDMHRSDLDTVAQVSDVAHLPLVQF